MKASPKAWRKSSSTGWLMFMHLSNSRSRHFTWPWATLTSSSQSQLLSQKKTTNWSASPACGSQANTKKFTHQECQTTQKSLPTPTLWDRWEEWRKRFWKSLRLTWTTSQCFPCCKLQSTIIISFQNWRKSLWHMPSTSWSWWSLMESSAQITVLARSWLQ